MHTNGMDEHYMFGLGYQILYYKKYGPNTISPHGKEYYHSASDFKVSMANKTVYTHRQPKG